MNIGAGVHDKCDDSTIYLTLYKTGNLLVQAEQQSKNSYFINAHLEELYVQVYKRSKSQLKISHNISKTKTPLRKLTKPRISILKTFKCTKCDFETNISSQLMKHKKTLHGNMALKNTSTPVDITVSQNNENSDK